MFGCHSCSYSKELKQFKSYDESPCATCKTRENPPPISHYETDPAEFNTLQVMHPSYSGSEDVFDDFKRQVFTVMSETMMMLIEMNHKFPTTFQFVLAKMKEPNLSYSDLAKRFSCKKQNVQYHLKKAVELCPEISSAMLVDSRFSGGHYALKDLHSGALFPRHAMKGSEA